MENLRYGRPDATDEECIAAAQLADADAFIRTVEFMVKFADPLVNAKVFPIPREIPKDLLEKLTMYRKLMGVKTDNEDGAK